MEDQVGFKTSCHFTHWAMLSTGFHYHSIFPQQIQLNAPYPDMLFSYMQNASCNAILKAFFKINQYRNLRYKSAHY